MSMEREPAVLSSLGTLVCEAKKIKSFRSVLTTPLTSFVRKAAELDQTRLAFVPLQAKLGKPRAEFFQTRCCFLLILETNHKVE